MSNKNSKNKNVSPKVDEVKEPAEAVVAPPVVEVEEEVAVPVAAPEPEASWPLVDWYGFVLAKIGQPYYVLAGAMAEEDPAADYTETEIRSLVEKFLNSPVR